MPSSNIDKRIVEMNFDNARFEKNVNQSISTLDRLKNALNMKGAEKGFNQLERSANSVNFSGLERSLTNIEHRLSTFGIAGARVVTTITDKALGALGKLNNAVFGQMKSGGISRALNLEHANFMMEGLLKNADKVSEIMGSDGPVQKSVKGTAYGLDEAANAAAQFVASGVTDLTKLENALTGISGAAAMTGSGFTEISDIFTTVAGNGRLMASELQRFSARGLNVAAALGEQLNKTETEIREMVSKGKIDFETFSEAMNKAFGEQAKKANETFNGALSNVKAALSRIGAKVAAPTIENLRVIFVQLISVIDATSKTLQPFIDLINDAIYKISYGLATFLGDVDNIQKVIGNIVDTFIAAFQVLYSIILPVKRAFQDLFPSGTITDAIKLTEIIRDFTRSLALNADAMITVRRIARGVFAVFDILAQIISALIRVIFPSTSGIRDFFKSFANGAASLGDYIYALSLVLKESDLLYKVFSNLRSVVGGGFSFIADSIKNISAAFKDGEGPIQKTGNVFTTVFGVIGAVIQSVSPLLGSFASVCGNALSEIGHALETVLTGGGFKTLLALVNSSFLVTIGLDIAAFIHHIIGSMSAGLKIIDGIRALFANVNTHIRVMTQSVKADVLIKIAKAIAILAASLFILASIPSEDLTRAVIALGLVGAGLLGFMHVVDKMASKMSSFKQGLGMFANGALLTGIAASVLILAGAMKVVSSIDSEKLMNSLGVITALLGELLIVALTLSLTEAKIKTGALSLIEMSIAVKILGSAIAQIGNLSWEQIAKGLVGVTASLVGLAGAAIAMKGSGFGVGSGTAILLMAVALKTLGSTISEIATLSWGGIAKGVVAIGAALAELWVFMRIMQDTSGMFAVAIAMDLMALAINGIANALTKLGTMNPLEMTTALVGMGVALAEMGIALTLLGENAIQCIGAAAAIGLLAISLNALIPILALFSTMNLPQLGITLLGLAGALTIMGVAAAVFGSAAPLLAVGAGVIALIGAACLVSAAGMAASALAIGLLVSAFEALSTISWLDLISGIGKLVVVFTVLGVSAIALAAALPTMLGIAGAMIGIGTAAMVLAASVTVAAIGTALMADALMKFEDISWDAICKGLLTLLGALLGLGVAALALSPLAPIILSIGAGVAMIGGGALAAAAALLIFSQALSTLIPIIQQIVPVVGQFVAGVWDFLVDLWAKVEKWIVDVGAGMLKGIADFGGLILHGLIELGAAMLKALGVPKDWVDVAKDFMHGLVTGITEGIKGVIDKVANVGKSMIDSIRNAIDSHSDSKETIAVGHDFDGGLITGIGDLKDKVIGKVAEVGKGMIDQAKSDANKVTEVWEATTKMYGKNLEFDVGLKNGTIQYVGPGGGYINTKTNELKNLIQESKSAIDAIDQEIVSSGGNTGATKSNTKAKKENEKANKKKNKSINEETEALNEETEAANDNSEAIREMAEEIEIVTEEYNRLNHYQGISKATVVRLTNNIKRIDKVWDNSLTTLKAVNDRYKEINKSIPNMVKASKRGLYTFGDGIKNVRKIFKKTGLKKSVDTIRKYVERTSNSVAKVTANTLKVFYKVGNKVDKIFLNPVKKMSKIPGMLKKALNTVAFFNRDMTSTINSYEWSDDVISHVRMIEDSFGRVKFGQMSEGIQNYLKNVLGRFKELNPAISQISKSLGGTYNIFSKNSRAAAATADSLISLGAVLYNGSDAANEYATKIAQLEFLYEHGEVSWEELQEAKIDYLTRIKDALMEYKQSLDETYMKEVDFFSAFNKNALDKNVNLMENLFSNISGYYTYGAMLTELSRRVPALAESTQLVKMLADAGVDSFGKLQKVLEMTSSELNAYIYGIGVLNKTQEEASNKAFAAVANSTSYAAKRQQAQAKDVMKKTTKYSKDVRKAIMSDMDAVAQATTEYNTLNAKQEKEYLKTLTKEEKKYYKKQKSYYKKAKKDYEAQRKAQTEKEYVKQLLENIKTFADYSKALAEYTGDTKALTSFTNKFNEAFADLSKNAKEVGVNLDAADDTLLIFAETLDATGEDGLNYFEEMAKRIQNMIDGIKESITNVNILTTAFEKAASVKFKNVYENVISNLIGSSDIVSQLAAITAKGYSTDVAKKVKEVYDSDRSAGLELIKALNEASADEVKRTNAAMEKYSKTSADTEANMWTKWLSNAEKTKAEREKKQTDALNKYNQATNTRKAKENELKALQSQKDTIDAEKQRLKELKKNVKDGDKLSKKTEKEYIALLKKYGGSYKGKSYSGSAPLQTWFDENGVQKSGTAYAKLKSDIAKAEKEVNALRDAEDKAHQEYLDAIKELEEYNAELKKSIDNVTKDENAKKWFDTVIKGEKTLLTAIKSVAKGTHEYVKALGYATELQTKFNDEIVHYNIDGLYSNIKALEDATAPIGTIVDGLDSFGKSLVEAADRTAEGIIEAIEEYKKSLSDTIKQSSDFFSKFSGFADEDNPLQAADYLEYADSQINALETWYTNLEKLADLGLDKELVEKFASQGLGSYEIVNALVNASKSQIGEYNSQWKKYQDTIKAATDSAMTSIYASFSTAGQTLSQSMIDYFEAHGADRLKEVGYEASAMVITGVKDGLTEAMPSIISAMEHTDTSGMSKAIGKSVGQGINTGLVEAVQGSVNETVTAVIEKFKMAVDSVLAYTNEVLPSEFTITIRVDTSDIDAAVARMNQAIYSTNVTAGQTSNAVAASTANQAATEVIPSEPVTNTVNLNYTQNNYSPKALDQVEIYRNTQNQLNSTKQALELQGAG